MTVFVDSIHNHISQLLQVVKVVSCTFDGCVYVFQWKIFVIIASYLTNFEKCGIKHVNI